MKKALALLLALCLMATLFVGCGGETTPSAAPSTAPSAAPGGDEPSDAPETDPSAEPVELVDAKIGVCLYNLEDNINIRRKATWEYFASQYDNVEVSFQAAGSEAEDNITAVENFLLQGCNGIVISTPEGIDEIRALCDDAGAYLFLITGSCTDEDMWNAMCESEYWLGSMNYSPAGEAELMAEWIVENGYREIIIIAAPEGLIAFETAMQNAYYDYFDNWNAENPDDQVITHVYQVQHANMADTCAAALAAHPDADMVIGTESGLKFCYPQIANANKLGQIGLCTWTVYDTAEDAFANGTLKYILPKPDDQAFAFYVMYNAIQGVPLADEPLEYISGTVRIKSSEDWLSPMTMPSNSTRHSTPM